MPCNSPGKEMSSVSNLLLFPLRQTYLHLPHCCQWQGKSGPSSVWDKPASRAVNFIPFITHHPFERVSYLSMYLTFIQSSFCLSNVKANKLHFPCSDAGSPLSDSKSFLRNGLQMLCAFPLFHLLFNFLGTGWNYLPKFALGLHIDISRRHVSPGVTFTDFPVAFNATNFPFSILF